MRAGQVIVYVEGPSDKMAMESLLEPILDRAKQKGTSIRFFPLNGKAKLMHKGPKKALNILGNKPNDHVVLLPDLYPKNRGGEHETFEELNKLLEERFNQAMETKEEKNPELIFPDSIPIASNTILKFCFWPLMRSWPIISG